MRVSAQQIGVLLAVFSVGCGRLVCQDVDLAQGPFLGHVEPTRALVWARATADAELRLEAVAGEQTVSCAAEADSERDRCLVWDLRGLRVDTTYTYRVLHGDRVLRDGDDYRLRTAPDPDADGTVRLCFGSCAREDLGTATVWRRLATEDIDVLCLLGDTPYIDTTNFAKQRARYAAFASVKPMAELLRSTSWYGTWDDHDFASNDTDGRPAGKPRSRRAFVEYHAHSNYGDGEHGVYTRFRRGPVEVFLLDTRYFAATEPSPYRKHHASLLGKKQWRWLRKGLEQSTAPVKVLACGMIWNGATRPGKQDHWGSYAYERDALFEFLGEKKIGGVVLVGGDIHRSRVIRHAAKDLAGYDILELISSPMHAGIIVAANAPHPGLIKDMGEPHTFLLLEVERRDRRVASARARFVNGGGTEHFRIEIPIQ